MFFAAWFGSLFARALDVVCRQREISGVWCRQRCNWRTHFIPNSEWCALCLQLFVVALCMCFFSILSKPNFPISVFVMAARFWTSFQSWQVQINIAITNIWTLSHCVNDGLSKGTHVHYHGFGPLFAHSAKFDSKVALKHRFLQIGSIRLCVCWCRICVSCICFWSVHSSLWLGHLASQPFHNCAEERMKLLRECPQTTSFNR